VDHHKNQLLLSVTRQLFGKSTYEGDEKENNVHDAERERSLQHGAFLVKVQAGIGKASSETEPPDIDAGRVCISPSPLSAIPMHDIAQIVDTGDERADKEQVDDGAKQGRVASRVVGDEGGEGPGGGEDGHYEENQDHGGRETVGLVVIVDKPREHADDGDQGD